ncbi:MAG: hypothetical protein EON54_18530 [Alcaligenaceae bacterium]|nr:MAG: hypothetical protein EON54_18530 [Alcaligenaceae bacterium]
MYQSKARTQGMPSNSTHDQSTPAPTLGCDSHVHLFMPEQFPYSPERQYTPPAAKVTDLRVLQRKLGMSRVVLVQPSCYGTDNRALLAGLADLGPLRARGVAVVDPEFSSDEELRQLHSSGVRGLRLNLSVQKIDGIAQLARQLESTQERCVPLGWHVQINADAAALLSLASVLEKMRVPMVFDHLAGGTATAAMVTRLLHAGNAWVKVSAPYRLAEGTNQAEMEALVRRLVQANPHRLVWGSDWPHTGGTGVRQTDPSHIEPFRNEDAVATFRLLERWVPSQTVREGILVHNPAALYDY